MYGRSTRRPHLMYSRRLGLSPGSTGAPSTVKGGSHKCPQKADPFGQRPILHIGDYQQARRVNTPPVPQDLKTLLARCGFTDISTYSISPTAGTSRLQDFSNPSTLGRPHSLDFSTLGRPALQDSRRSDGLSSTLLAPSMLGV
ncbi:hypothetical protein B0H11DRAFT_2249111 [Mycena galericulata]|nr:hypothetical protein B0H11DRAFT_2249111 [Mycena galericulata]